MRLLRTLLGALLCGFAVGPAAIAGDLRDEIVIVPYRAATTEAKQDAFEMFRSLIIQTLQNKGWQLHSDLSGRVDEAHIAHFLSLQDGTPLDPIGTPADAISYYRDFGPLAIMDGSVAEGGGRRQFRSNIYVGPKLGPFTEQRFSVTYVHEVDDIAEPESAHMFYFLYALAKDAQRAGLPGEIVKTLVKEASFAVQDLNEKERRRYGQMIEDLARLVQ